MKKSLAFLLALITIVSFQNCANDVGFEAEDMASMMGVGLAIVPDPNNVNQIEQKLNYTLAVSLPKKGQLKDQAIRVNNQYVPYEKDAAGDIHFSFITAKLTTYQIEAEVWTPDGTSFTASHSVEISDEKPPKISLAPSTQNKYDLGQTLNFLFEAHDEGGGTIEKLNCFVDDEPITCKYDQNFKGNLSLSNLSSGDHKLEIKASDNFQNDSQKEITFSIAFDKLAPAITILPDEKNKYYTLDQQFFTLQVEEFGSGLQSLNCQVNDLPVSCTSKTGEIPLSLKVDIAGAYVLKIQATDNQGNVGSKSYTFTMIDDNKAPVIVLKEDSANSYLIPQVQMFSMKVTDQESGLSSYSCFLNDVPVSCSLESGVGSLNLTPTTAGTQTLKVEALDRYKNKGSATLVFDMVKDSSAPEIQLIADPSNTHLINESMKFSFSVTDVGVSGINTVTCYNGTSPATCSFDKNLGKGSLAVTYSSKGSKLIKIEAKDRAGNTSTKSLSFEIKALNDINQTFTIALNKKVDVLFVIDNSGSMKEEQANMAARISSFVSKISGMDWRAAVTTTDVDKENGALVPIKNLFPVQYFVTSSMNTTQAQTNLGATVQGVGLAGSGNEQGIRATYKTLELRSQAPHVNFFRNDAAFAVILISDEDETGATAFNKPEELVAYFKNIWPQKAFSFSSIVKTDAACIGYAPGNAYLKMSELTGKGLKGGAVTGCVGDADYSNVLGKIGTSVQKINDTINLQCSPYPGTTMTVKKDNITYSGTYTISNGVMSFHADLPVGSYSLSYKCEK